MTFDMRNWMLMGGPPEMRKRPTIKVADQEIFDSFRHKESPDTTCTDCGFHECECTAPNPCKDIDYGPFESKCRDKESPDGTGALKVNWASVSRKF